MSKYEQLKHDLRERSEGGIALAFSGGVDSSLLLAVLKELHDEAPFPLLALTLHSIFQRPEELEEVRKAAGKAGIELKLFGCDPLSIPEVKYNPPDRCFWCKRYLFSEIKDFAAARGIGTVIDGHQCRRPEILPPRAGSIGGTRHPVTACRARHYQSGSPPHGCGAPSGMCGKTVRPLHGNPF